MNISRLLHTILYLKPKQIFFQLRKFVVKPKYVQMSAPIHRIPTMTTTPIAKYKCVKGEEFSFLNLEHQFAGWTFTDNGMLWAYNQNYFDWINQEGMTAEEGCKWIDLFNSQLSTLNSTLSFDPYPIALRGINWIKFFCSHPGCATKEREDSLYSQYCLLERTLEYHLLGNHLLEDAYSLTIGGCYFGDERMKQKGKKLLLRELQEQILPDGAHYEQSPMYHCILLDRLLDTYNITQSEELIPYAQRMLGHLESICYKDGTWPFFGDAALGIAPSPQAIYDYARRLGISWEARPLKGCGYRKMQSGKMEAFVDAGNITASYQPGHSHADALTFELRIDGTPFIVDTGISTYNKTERRQLERSTAAHNTVTVNGQDSSEVWGGFRVGKRAHVKCLAEDIRYIEAEHDGFEKPCRRRFEIKDDAFVVKDWFDGEAISLIHLAEGADASRIHIEGAQKVETKPWKYSTEYNWFHEGTVIEILFNGQLTYTIRCKSY